MDQHFANMRSLIQVSFAISRNLTYFLFFSGNRSWILSSLNTCISMETTRTSTFATDGFCLTSSEVRENGKFPTSNGFANAIVVA